MRMQMFMVGMYRKNILIMISQIFFAEFLCDIISSNRIGLSRPETDNEMIALPSIQFLKISFGFHEILIHLIRFRSGISSDPIVLRFFRINNIFDTIVHSAMWISVFSFFHMHQFCDRHIFTPHSFLWFPAAFPIFVTFPSFDLRNHENVVPSLWDRCCKKRFYQFGLTCFPCC